MLQNLDGQISDCLHHAADCAEPAKAATSERERKDWIDLEASYMTLARSIELGRRLDRFSGEVRRTLKKLNPDS